MIYIPKISFKTYRTISLSLFFQTAILSILSFLPPFSPRVLSFSSSKKTATAVLSHTHSLSHTLSFLQRCLYLLSVRALFLLLVLTLSPLSSSYVPLSFFNKNGYQPQPLPTLSVSHTLSLNHSLTLSLSLSSLSSSKPSPDPHLPHLLSPPSSRLPLPVLSSSPNIRSITASIHSLSLSLSLSPFISLFFNLLCHLPPTSPSAAFPLAWPPPQPFAASTPLPPTSRLTRILHPRLQAAPAPLPQSALLLHPQPPDASSNSPSPDLPRPHPPSAAQPPLLLPVSLPRALNLHHPSRRSPSPPPFVPPPCLQTATHLHRSHLQTPHHRPLLSTVAAPAPPSASLSPTNPDHQCRPPTPPRPDPSSNPQSLSLSLSRRSLSLFPRSLIPPPPPPPSPLVDRLHRRHPQPLADSLSPAFIPSSPAPPPASLSHPIRPAGHSLCSPQIRSLSLSHTLSISLNHSLS